MKPEVLFPEIYMFDSKNIAPVQISKSCRRRLKKKEKLQSLKKEAGVEEADRPSIPSPQDLQDQNTIVPLPSKSIGFEGSIGGMGSVDGKTTSSMDDVQAEIDPGTEKKRRLPATFDSAL